jgi:hypothetical protein
VDARALVQKIMIWMGTDNASRAKAKLRAIRGEILAAQKNQKASSRLRSFLRACASLALAGHLALR